MIRILNDVDIEWNSGGNATNTSTWSLISMINDFLNAYKGFVLGVLGLADLTMVAIFIWILVNIASGSTSFTNKNINSRRLLIWFISMALLGSLNLVVALIYNMMSN